MALLRLALWQKFCELTSLFSCYVEAFENFLRCLLATSSIVSLLLRATPLTPCYVGVFESFLRCLPALLRLFKASSLVSLLRRGF